MSGAKDAKDKRRDWAKKCQDWWRSLQRHQADGTANPTADPGALARLRRAASPLDAAKEPQTIELYRRLHCARFDARKLEATAVVAAVLAGIRADAPGPTAELLGKGEQPVMSPLRMRRLTSARNVEETLRGFREVVSLLGGTAPVADVALSILDWLDDDRADRRKTRWLYHYHSAGIADPTREGEPDATDPAASA